MWYETRRRLFTAAPPCSHHSGSFSQTPGGSYWVNVSCDARVQQGLGVCGVKQRTMLVFYQAVIESALRYGIAAWFGDRTVKMRAELNRLVSTALKVMEAREQPTLQQQTEVRQTGKISADRSHVLYPQYELLPYGRPYTIPVKYKRRYLNRYRNSLIPIPLHLLNAGHKAGLRWGGGVECIDTHSMFELV